MSDPERVIDSKIINQNLNVSTNDGKEGHRIPSRYRNKKTLNESVAVGAEESHFKIVNNYRGNDA